MKNQAHTCGTHQPQKIHPQLVSSERLRTFDGEFMNVAWGDKIHIGIHDPKTKQLILVLPDDNNAE